MIRNTTEFGNELVHFFNEHYFSDEAIVGINNKCSFFLKLFAILLQIYGFIFRKKYLYYLY